MRMARSVALCVASATCVSTAFAAPEEPGRFNLVSATATGESGYRPQATDYVDATTERTDAGNEVQDQVGIVGERFSAAAWARAVGAEASVDATAAGREGDGRTASTMASSRSSARSATHRP